MAFETLKIKLIESILAIYYPKAYTMMQVLMVSGLCMMQWQGNGVMHSTFYFNRSTIEVEAKYHCFELDSGDRLQIPCLLTGYSIRNYLC